MPNTRLELGATSRPPDPLSSRITETNQMTNITALPRTKPPATTKASKPNKAHARRLKRQGAAAVAIGAVASTLTALSLCHLAHGIEIVTAAPRWEAWAMAIGIDIAMIGTEMTMLTTATDKEIGRA